MHPRLAELFAFLDAERAALRTTLDAIPAAERDVRPAPDRWSVRDVVEHLLIVEQRITRLIAKGIAEGRAAGIEPERDESPVLPTVDRAMIVDRARRIVAPPPTHPQGGDDVETLWAALVDARAALRATALTGDGLALGTVSYPHVAFGPLNLYQWIGFVGGHEARHAAQIREIVAHLRGAPMEASA